MRVIPLVVLRPEPGASATAVRAREAGLEAIVAPLFAMAPLGWDAPDPAGVEAVVLTSAHTLRLGGAGLGLYRHLPAFAVGEVTAAAAREAGFASVKAGGRDAAELLALVAARGVSRALHLCGEDYRDAAVPGLSVTRVPVYRGVAIEALPSPISDALAAGPAVAALHSPRAGQVFAGLIDDAAIPRAQVALAAISAAAADAAGQGWRAIGVAPVPTDAAVLAEAARLCEMMG